jgi:predicted transcriptional regulator of viral defense system
MREELRSHRAMAELATRQHGAITSGQLRRLGYSSSAIQRAVQAAQLHRLHRGVYAVGHERISAHGRCLAAVLACGPSALLSHFAACWLWGLLPGSPGAIDVTVPTRGHSRDAVRVHHATSLAEEDRAVRDGIPVTAVPRTLSTSARPLPAGSRARSSGPSS